MSSTAAPIEEWSAERQRCGLAHEIKGMCDAADELTAGGEDIWGWFRNWSPPEGQGYIWCEHPCKDKLLAHRLVRLEGHSGGSLAMCMRAVQAIARQGFANWNKN